MYDLSTLKRINDEAALREQFPDHDCTDSDEWSDAYTLTSNYDDLAADRDALAVLAQEYAELIRSQGDEFAARDIEAIIAVRS